MATFAFYPNVANATLAVFIPKLARFLIDDLAGFTGPASGWTVIQTYSSAAVAPFEVPPDPTNMDSLAADNGWRTGVLVVNDYIILESGSGANKFQVGFEYQAAGTLRTITAPFGGFDIAALQVDMDNAANWLNPRLALVDHTMGGAGGVVLGNYSIIANDAGDDYSMYFQNGDMPSMRMGFSGKLENAFATDTKPVVTYIGPTIVYGNTSTGITGQSYWRRISAVDDTTAILLDGSYLYGGTLGMLTNSANGYSNDAEGTASYRVTPLWLNCAVAGHYGMQGTLPSIYSADYALAAQGAKTINAKAYGYMKNNDTAGVMFPWDGVTVLP